MDGISFEIQDDALNFIVEKAMDYKLGARGLRSLCESIFIEAMYEMPSSDSKSLVVDKSYAERHLSFERLSKLKAVS